MNPTKKSLIDEHLSKIQQETNATLNNFKQFGFNVDKMFMKHFLKVSIDRMEKTCKRYQSEGKLETSNEVPNGKTMSSMASHTEVSTIKSMKRKSDESYDNVEDPKKLKVMPSIGTGADDFTVFYCDHCLHPNGCTKLFSGSIDEVYEHWFTTHLDETISKPFHFQAVGLARCFNCDKIGTYRDLENHHKEQHKSTYFVITDRINKNKCGICHFEYGDVVKHFNAIHKVIYPPIAFNPISYSEERITQLMAINIEKECHCIDCDQRFKTCNELVNHRSVSHDGKIIDTQSHQTELSYLYCGFCEKKIDGDAYFSHFLEHPYSFRCSKCKHESDDVAELVFHERSLHGVDNMQKHCGNFPNWLRNKFLNAKMVFTNGLVLKVHNALGTKLDDSKTLNEFIKDYLNGKKDSLKQMIKVKNPATLHRNDDKAPDENTMLSELLKQLKLDKSLYIGGIFGSVRNIDKEKIFLTLCQTLQLNITMEDVKQIEMHDQDGMVVEFFKLGAKNDFLNRSQKQTIWSNEVFKMSDNKKKWKIVVRHHLTPFYRNIDRFASKLKHENKIHSFWMDMNGFMVKCKPTERGRPILSIQQLRNYIKDV
ncbi:uncharacterized protein LOC116341072 [Contarinia nasturtii]|uniref:uncharacterized protein LOC116341072 n=1 Tax=Contarinia nasturtii TaxID=265458 RepID=UPI0012D42D2E|nr:uncharacterized protein LOC116341072 [Contarinia nasturtii]